MDRIQGVTKLESFQKKQRPLIPIDSLPSQLIPNRRT